MGLLLLLPRATRVRTCAAPKERSSRSTRGALCRKSRTAATTGNQDAHLRSSERAIFKIEPRRSLPPHYYCCYHGQSGCAPAQLRKSDLQDRPAALSAATLLLLLPRAIRMRTCAAPKERSSRSTRGALCRHTT